jgi:hypothetical protein
VDRRTVRRNIVGHADGQAEIGERRWTGGQLGWKLMDRRTVWRKTAGQADCKAENLWTGGQSGGKLVNVGGQVDS